MVDMEPPKSVDATLFGSSEALIHRSGSGISVLLGVSDGFRIHLTLKLVKEIKHLAMQTSEKRGRISANPQPDATGKIHCPCLGKTTPGHVRAGHPVKWSPLAWYGDRYGQPIIYTAVLWKEEGEASDARSSYQYGTPVPATRRSPTSLPPLPRRHRLRISPQAFLAPRASSLTVPAPCTVARKTCEKGSTWTGWTPTLSRLSRQSH